MRVNTGWVVRASVILAIGFVALGAAPAPEPAPAEVAAKLKGFDAYMEKVLKDWNSPGIGVGIVVGDRLVYAKGYGYRDYGKKLPFTPTTLQQIASNTKLFTAVATGLVVEEGKLTWDKPVRQSVPAIQFYNDQLNTSVTLRDMLSHRTGITRHDLIWYRGDDTRKQLFEKLQYMEPKEPLRTMFLYNNMMFAAAGYLIELAAGQDLGGVRPRAHLPAARDDEHDLLHRGDDPAARLRRGIHRETRHLRALQDPLLRGHRGRRPVRRHHLEHRGHVALADRPDERGQVQGQAGPARRRPARPRSSRRSRCPTRWPRPAGTGSS